MVHLEQEFQKDTGFHVEDISWTEKSGRYADWLEKKIESLQAELKEIKEQLEITESARVHQSDQIKTVQAENKALKEPIDTEALKRKISEFSRWDDEQKRDFDSDNCLSWRDKRLNKFIEIFNRFLQTPTQQKEP